MQLMQLQLQRQPIGGRTGFEADSVEKGEERLITAVYYLQRNNNAVNSQ